MKKKKNLYNILKNHTLEEYKAKYDISKAIVLSKDAVDKFNKKQKHAKTKNNIFYGRNWWLIDNNYYEVGEYLKIKPFIHKTHAAGFKIALASVLGGVGIGGALGGGGYIVYKTVINAPKQDIKVTGVTLSPTTLELGKSDTSTLVATVSPNNATDKSLTWSSSNNDIVTVDENGVVKSGVSEGNATITVKTNDGGFTASCEVAVKSIIHVTGITLDRTSLTQYPGVNDRLVATVLPAKATNKNVNWVSSDSTICSVDSEGKISGLKDGTCKITGTTEDGGFSQSCDVTIKGTFIDVNPTGDSTCSVAITADSDGTVFIPAEVTINGKVYKTTSIYTDLSSYDLNEKVTAVVFEEGNLIEEIGNKAFCFCTNLKTINLEACTNLKKIGQQAFGFREWGETSCCRIESLTLPESLEFIDEYCFLECTYLKEINNFAKTKITTISNGTFDGCTNLASIDLTNITEIGETAFYGCYSLCNGGNFVIPANCTKVGSYAFEGCNEIKTLTIENNVIPAIDDYEYTGLYGSADVLYVPTGTTVGRQISRTFTKSDTSEKEGFDKYIFNSIGYTYKKWNDEARCYVRAGSEFADSTLAIKSTDGVTGDEKNLGGVQGNGFKNKTCIESVTFVNRPETFYTIEKGAFEGCTNLKTINFGDTAQEFVIYQEAFKNCTSLESIDLSYVQHMYANVFYGCKNLQTVILPNESATSELFYTNETGVFTYVGEQENPTKRIIKVKKDLDLPEEHYLKVHASNYTITYDDTYSIYTEN